MNGYRTEYKCAACGHLSPMELDIAGVVVPLVGALELTRDLEDLPAVACPVPTCLGLAHHELCLPCRVDGGCAACVRVAHIMGAAAEASA